jgi:hypothetical protein
MILLIQVMSMNDESFKVLVIVVVAILVISLVINAFLATDPRSFSSPPLRAEGYFTEHGDPMPGYYSIPNHDIQTFGVAENSQSCK